MTSKVHSSVSYETGRPPVERYFRCSSTTADFEVDAGIEMRTGDDAELMAAQLSAVALTVARRAQSVADVVRSSEAVAPIFEATWPGRAYFVEIHDARSRAWTQVFQPFGVPRNRPAKPERSAEAWRDDFWRAIELIRRVKSSAFAPQVADRKIDVVRSVIQSIKEQINGFEAQLNATRAIEFREQDEPF